MKDIILNEITEVKVRFSEVDSLRIVWHGHYLKYFEEGREAFGKKYGISYLDILQNGLLTPIVNVNCDYKKSLEYGDSALIETVFRNTEASKICFDFIIKSKKLNEVVATGSTTQVFLNLNRELLLVSPDFFIQWKNKYNLI